MNKISKTLSLVAALAMTSGATAQQLTNGDFADGYAPWIGVSNIFQGGAYIATLATSAGEYNIEDVVTTGDSIVFSSRDDGTSDLIENFLIQEFGAGPAAPTLSVFNTGDVIRFSGRARSTKTGSDTSDVITRAFIKTLGYNELGWAFQIKDEYTVFFDLNNDWQDFDLSITYPDLAVDDSLQVIQLGFEVTTAFDGGSNTMDAGTIEFTNAMGGVGGETWNGYDVTSGGDANTESWMGWVNVTSAPLIYSYSLEGWLYMPEQDTTGGAWVYVFR